MSTLTEAPVAAAAGAASPAGAAGAGAAPVAGAGFVAEPSASAAFFSPPQAASITARPAAIVATRITVLTSPQGFLPAEPKCPSGTRSKYPRPTPSQARPTTGTLRVGPSS